MTLACGKPLPPSGPATPATREVVDDIGRHVQVAARPERIVSLAPSITEILFAIGAGDRIVATTSFCTFPPEAANTTKIGDTQRPDVERILALNARRGNTGRTCRTDLLLSTAASTAAAAAPGDSVVPRAELDERRRGTVTDCKTQQP